MPKIIKDVDTIIKKCAMELFVKYGYLKVDMKMISANSQIAVGTIYHYYKNKQDLYLKVLNESWEITFTKLDEIIASNYAGSDKSNLLVTTLYHDIKERHGLGKVLFDNSVEELKNNNFFIKIQEDLLGKVKTIISSIDQEREHIDSASRLSEVFMVSIMAMIELHPNEEELNIAFLKQLIS